jgi:hypothetical protein
MYPESSAVIYAPKRFPSSTRSYFAASYGRLSHHKVSRINRVRTSGDS